MFLTTEPGLPEQNYTRLQVISGAGSVTEGSSSDAKLAQAWNAAFGRALADIELQARNEGQTA